jgi:small subunit ribosomal protein S29
MAATEYSPIPNTSPTLYSQSTYAANWLGQIAKANNTVLSNLRVTKEHTLPIPIRPDASLARMAELGSRDPEVSWPIFKAFWSEITSRDRPPIVMALDGLGHIMKDSLYRSPDFKFIHAHDLAIVKLFVEYLAGVKQLPNGGAIFAATTTGNNPTSYATSLALKQKEERKAGKDVTQPDPYKKIDLRSFNSLQSAELLKLKGLSKMEARGLMEYWAASGVLRQRVDEKSVTERWVLSGNGVVGEIEKSALWMRI